MGKSDGDTHRREPGAPVLGPLDKGNRAIEVGLEVAPLLSAEAAHAIEVEVRDRRRGLVAVADRERGARNGRFDAERAARAANEGRLPRTELARDADDVAGPKPGGKPRPERLGLLSACRENSV